MTVSATLLVLAGIALMAVAIFAPRRLSSTVSVASSPAPAGGAPLEARTAYDERLRPPRWPQLVEPSATALDVAARSDLVDALAALDSAWSESVLRQALAEEADPGVRSAIVSALASSTQSLVT